MNVAEILQDSDYKLSQFTAEEIDSLEQAVILKQTKSGAAPYVSCLIRNKEIRLSPEEVIRQLYLRVLTDRYQYPTNRIRVEYEVSFGREKKRADIAVMDKDRPTVPYMIVELKKPKLKDGKDQLRSYCNATGSPIAVWTNGDQISHYHRKDPNYFEDITDIPNANQTLADVLNIRFTLADLVKKDKLVTEKKSLKTLIQEMEDEVLANAGVDVFEELFKLIFTKLFDEWESGRGNRRNTRILEFRNTGQTEAELRTKIQGLFDRAKKKWQGVFKNGDKISLSPSHLSICVSSLENVKLFNSNLDVVDEAFEYLINQTSKGEKGQYFTPRYVIDMYVKMLNPKADESLIDTAAGSSGFPVHAMFYVWRQIYRDEGETIDPMFSADEKLPACEDYVREKVFAIDFDEKAVRVARTLNLIAGDGQTNVLYLNTLDYEMWEERIKDDDWRDVYNDGFKRLRGYQAQKGDYKAFKFDIVMANPPFAGEIKEQRITAKYDLALKPNGKRAEKMGRDILFIERNLDCLKPGGRMAVVLPQGRFNNSSDKHIRDVIAERCRILAVVGLHGNTFKPHTGTKTSVLFVQKWNDDPKVGALCTRVEDYNIFFATMRKSGKDNSGEKIYVRRQEVIPPAPLQKGGEVVGGGKEGKEIPPAPLQKGGEVVGGGKEGKEIPPAPLQKGGEEEGSSGSPFSKGGWGGSSGEYLLDEHGHLIVDHDLFNHDGLTEDGIAEAFIEFAKKEKLSFFKSSPSVEPFDQAKYDRLMGGLEAAELAFGYVIKDNESFRFDSEYFKKEYLEFFNDVESYEYLSEFVESGYRVVYETTEIIDIEEGKSRNCPVFLQATDISTPFIDADDLFYVDEADWIRYTNGRIQHGELLIEVKGKAEKIAIVPEDFPEKVLVSGSLYKLTTNKRINKHYLLIYLICKYGASFRERYKSNLLISFISKNDLYRIPIPTLSHSLQSHIEEIFKLLSSFRNLSLELYKQAEELLLSELGLNDWQPIEDTIAVKRFSDSWGGCDRGDAEHYKPKYDQILDEINKLKPERIANLEELLITITNGQTPLHHNLAVGEVKFLTAEHIDDFRINYGTEKRVTFQHHATELTRTHLVKGDVLLTIKGKVGNAAVVDTLDELVNINQDVALIRLIENIHPYYIAGFINSVAGKLLIQQTCTGQINPFLSLGNLRKVKIPIFKTEVMDALGKAIQAKVESARHAAYQSKQLLEIAKIGVERAIEEDEDRAIDWMNRQLKALDINQLKT